MTISLTSDLEIKLSNIEQSQNLFLNSLVNQFQQQNSITQQDDLSTCLKTLRQEALSILLESHFPTKKDEDWRFTDLSSLSTLNLQLAKSVSLSANTLANFSLPETEQSLLVFVNGIYAPDLSNISALPKGVYVGNLTNLPLSQNQKIVKYLESPPELNQVFRTLNTSGLQDLAIIWVEPYVVVEQTIQILFITVASEIPIFTQPRTLIIAETGSQLDLIEYYGAITTNCSDIPQNQPYFTNNVTDIWLADNAQINHSRIQRESGDSYHIANTAIAQAKNSKYTINEVNLGAKLYRHDLTINQTGEQTETALNGLTMIGNKQLADTHSLVSLNKPYGTVNQNHKYILDDYAHGVFNGKILVPQMAQFTNASQLNRNLLLSSKARINTKPELQITADNVKCAHGATISQLEADEIFYLRSRGLNSYDARNLLIDAFTTEILECLSLVSLQKRLAQCVACRTFN